MFDVRDYSRISESNKYSSYHCLKKRIVNQFLFFSFIYFLFFKCFLKINRERSYSFKLNAFLSPVWDYQSKHQFLYILFFVSIASFISLVRKATYGAMDRLVSLITYVIETT